MASIESLSYGTAAVLSLYPLARTWTVCTREWRWERHIAQLTAASAPPPAPLNALENRFAGCLVGGAIGDALGRMSESLPPWLVRLRFGTLRDFHPGLLRWIRRRGSVTDDTQLTLCVARSLQVDGRLDERQLGHELVDWLDYRVGAGKATVEAAQRLRRGMAWEEAAEASSGGNGTVIRIAPIALVWCHDEARRAKETHWSALGTHGHPLARSGARLLGDALALTVTRQIAAPAALVPALLHQERDPAWQEALGMIAELGDAPVAEGLRVTGKSGFVRDTVMAALWLCQRLGEDPEAAIVAAVNHGGDTDSIGCLVGQLMGAWHGLDVLPARWRQNVQGGQLLVDTARHLAALHDNIKQAAHAGDS